MENLTKLFAAGGPAMYVVSIASCFGLSTAIAFAIQPWRGTRRLLRGVSFLVMTVVFSTAWCSNSHRYDASGPITLGGIAIAVVALLVVVGFVRKMVTMARQ